MYEDSAQAQSVNPSCALPFQRITANFVPFDPAAGYKLQDQFCGGEVADNSKESDGIWSA